MIYSSKNPSEALESDMTKALERMADEIQSAKDPEAKAFELLLDAMLFIVNDQCDRIVNAHKRQLYHKFPGEMNERELARFESELKQQEKDLHKAMDNLNKTLKEMPKGFQIDDLKMQTLCGRVNDTFDSINHLRKMVDRTKRSDTDFESTMAELLKEVDEEIAKMDDAPKKQPFMLDYSKVPEDPRQFYEESMRAAFAYYGDSTEQDLDGCLQVMEGWAHQAEIFVHEQGSNFLTFCITTYAMRLFSEYHTEHGYAKYPKYNGRIRHLYQSLEKSLLAGYLTGEGHNQLLSATSTFINFLLEVNQQPFFKRDKIYNLNHLIKELRKIR